MVDANKLFSSQNESQEKNSSLIKIKLSWNLSKIPERPESSENIFNAGDENIDDDCLLETVQKQDLVGYNLGTNQTNFSKFPSHHKSILGVNKIGKIEEQKH
jgi:hypothetical protein